MAAITAAVSLVSFWPVMEQRALVTLLLTTLYASTNFAYIIIPMGFSNAVNSVLIWTNSE